MWWCCAAADATWCRSQRWPPLESVSAFSSWRTRLGMRTVRGAVLASLMPPQGHAQAHPHADWAVEKTFQIGSPGGWDYLTVDPRTHRLYVPRTTHTMGI